MEESQSSSNKAKKVETKLKFASTMETGSSWQQAAQAAGLQISRATAYRYLKSFQVGGAKALQDGRQGHPAKLKVEVQSWLSDYCHANPEVTSPQLQSVLELEWGLRVSVSRLNEVREKLGLTRQNLAPASDPKKRK